MIHAVTMFELTSEKTKTNTNKYTMKIAHANECYPVNSNGNLGKWKQQKVFPNNKWMRTKQRSRDQRDRERERKKNTKKANQLKFINEIDVD